MFVLQNLDNDSTTSWLTLKWTEILWLSEAYKNVNIWKQLQSRPMQIVLTFTGKETETENLWEHKLNKTNKQTAVLL